VKMNTVYQLSSCGMCDRNENPPSPKDDAKLSVMANDFYRAFRDHQIASYEPDRAFVQVWQLLC
jgi:hypothetical protein